MSDRVGDASGTETERPQRAIAAQLYCWYGNCTCDWSELTESERGFWIDRSYTLICQLSHFYRLERR